MEYIVNNQSKEIKLEVGLILQSNKTGEAYVIISTNASNMGCYGLLGLKELEIMDYAECMYKLTDNCFEKGFTILTQTVPAVFVKEV